MLHLVEMVLDDSSGKDKENEKHNTSVQQDSVALDHSLSLALILLHDVPGKDWRESVPKNAVEDALEG